MLWPSLQRDVLLSFAAEGLYRPVWSSAILEELEYHEAKKLVERHGLDRSVAAQRASRLIATMRSAFDDAEAQGWEALDGMYGLPDPDDEHVVAAAVVAGAGVIVTHNTKDFPRDRVPEEIEIQPPAEFAHNTVSPNPAAGRRALEAISARSGQRGRTLTVEDVLNTLELRYNFVEVAHVLHASSPHDSA